MKPLAALAAALMATTAAADDSTLQQAVQARLDEMQAAAENLDPDALFACVAANSQYPIAQDGTLYASREQALAATKESFQAITAISYHFDQQHVRFLNALTAIAVSKGTTSVTLQDGRSFSTPFAQTVIFTLQDGQWTVLHAHRSSPSR